MRFFNTLILLLMLMACASGCLIGNDVQTEVIPLTHVAHTPHQREVPIIHDSKSMEQRPFTRVALIEIQGARYDRAEEMLELLKARAAEVGADAVIEVEMDAITRHVSELFDDDPPEPYTSRVVRGVAVVYDVESAPEKIASGEPEATPGVAQRHSAVAALNREALMMRSAAMMLSGAVISTSAGSASSTPTTSK